MQTHPIQLAEILDAFRKTLRRAGAAGVPTAEVAADLEAILEKACHVLGINNDGPGILGAAEKIRDALFPESVLSGTSVNFRPFESLSRETTRSRALALVLASASDTEFDAPADLVFEWLSGSGRLPTQVLEH